MIRQFFQKILKDRFTARTTLFSILMALLFCWRGIEEGYQTATFIVIGYSLSYSIILICFKRKYFFSLQMIYSIILMYLEVFWDTGFCSNFTPFFCIIMAILYSQKYKNIALAFYVLSSFFVFLSTEEQIYDVGLHYLRCLWILEVVFEFNKNHFTGKLQNLNLDETDKIILDELLKGARQKEIDGISEQTVSRRLKDMRERNNCSLDELKFAYLIQKKQENFK
ncbi:MAG: hypothetical protein KBT03_03255 [Bacteroidales bacterium]|nr:hypothetical protein [Candidatus Scybalousia scybalohippi]